MSSCSLPQHGDIGIHDPKSIRTVQAIQLLKFGARAGLVLQLTGLAHSTIKQLYQQIHGTPSPPGQTPFTDAWYVQSELRMLHANLIWKLDCVLKPLEPDPAARLIDTYTSYLGSVHRAILTINRAYFVPQLLLIGAWRLECCVQCNTRFIGPLEQLSHVCPACRLRSVYRCESCGKFLHQKRVGRRMRLCRECKKNGAISRPRRSHALPARGL